MRFLIIDVDDTLEGASQPNTFVGQMVFNMESIRFVQIEHRPRCTQVIVQQETGHPVRMLTNTPPAMISQQFAPDLFL